MLPPGVVQVSTGVLVCPCRVQVGGIISPLFRSVSIDALARCVQEGHTQLARPSVSITQGNPLGCPTGVVVSNAVDQIVSILSIWVSSQVRQGYGRTRAPLPRQSLLVARSAGESLVTGMFLCSSPEGTTCTARSA